MEDEILAKSHICTDFEHESLSIVGQINIKIEIEDFIWSKNKERDWSDIMTAFLMCRLI